METLKTICNAIKWGFIYSFYSVFAILYAAGIVATIWMIIYFIKIIIYLFTL